VKPTRSILLFGEGKTEACFLSHLRDLYRVQKTAIKVEHGRGGSVQTVVQGAIKIAQLADYSGVLILLDDDRNDDPAPESWCKKHRLFIKRSSPCIEALFLEILEDKKLSKMRHGEDASNRSKSHFKGTYLQTDRDGQVISRLRNFFSKNFHRELLDEARSRISMLDEIIHAIEGKIG
jgi:hypothetical protein